MPPALPAPKGDEIILSCFSIFLAGRKDGRVRGVSRSGHHGACGCRVKPAEQVRLLPAPPAPPGQRSHPFLCKDDSRKDGKARSVHGSGRIWDSRGRGTRPAVGAVGSNPTCPASARVVPGTCNAYARQGQRHGQPCRCTTRRSSSAGRASAFQADGRGFDPRLRLQSSLVTDSFRLKIETESALLDRCATAAAPHGCAAPHGKRAVEVDSLAANCDTCKGKRGRTERDRKG